MGTRADFYVKNEKKLEWLGSIAWDGDPKGVIDEKVGNPALFEAKTERGFRGEVQALLKKKQDGTTPKMGWPWPWDNSKSTDYSYVFENGVVMCAYYGHGWFDPKNKLSREEKEALPRRKFPDMKKVKNVIFDGPRSGLISLG